MYRGCVFQSEKFIFKDLVPIEYQVTNFKSNKIIKIGYGTKEEHSTLEFCTYLNYIKKVYKTFY